MPHLYARYTDFLTGDTITVPAGTEDADYPRANIRDFLSRTVGRFTGTTGTFRRTFGGSVTPVAAFFLNTNATAIQLTNNAGLNEAVTVPTVPEDGLPLDFGIDLRSVANTTATQWNAALTGPTGVGLGEFLLVAALRQFYGLWMPVPTEDESHPVSHAETDHEVDLDYGFGIRVRRGAITFREEDGRAGFLAFERAQLGRLRPFVILPHGSFSDVLLALRDSDGSRIASIAGSPTVAGAFVSDMTIGFKEQQKGWALD